MVLTKEKTETTEEIGFSVKPIEKSYFSQTQVATPVEEDPLFEIEKEYDNITLPERKTKNSILPEFDILPAKKESQQTVKVENKQKQLTLSSRGKVLAVVCSLVMVLLLTMVIYNAVVLGAKGRDISRLASQIELKQSEVVSLQNMLKGSESEAQVAEFLKQNNSSLRKATSADKLKLLISEQDVETISAPSNWFDKLCKFLSELF